MVDQQDFLNDEVSPDIDNDDIKTRQNKQSKSKNVWLIIISVLLFSGKFLCKSFTTINRISAFLCEIAIFFKKVNISSFLRSAFSNCRSVAKLEIS